MGHGIFGDAGGPDPSNHGSPDEPTNESSGCPVGGVVGVGGGFCCGHLHGSFGLGPGGFGAGPD